MIALGPALNDYLTMRRALGYKLQRAEKLLAQFIMFVEASGSRRITIDLGLAWATLPAQGAMDWWSGRLTVVRGFATYLHALDPAIEVPPTQLLPAQSHRAVPYLYSDEDVVALMVAAETLRSLLRVLTYRTLIGLLAVTGMRIGEAIRLDRHDLDLEAGMLTVRLGKFGKSRELPLHASTLEAMHAYLQRPSLWRVHGCCTAVCTGLSFAWCAMPVCSRARRPVAPARTTCVTALPSAP